jgi:hypothetical protein
MQRVSKRRPALQEITNTEAGRLKKQRNDYYTETMGVEVTAATIKSKSIRAMKGVAARLAKQGGGAESVAALLASGDEIGKADKVVRPLEKGMAALRRQALQYHFVHILGAPPADVWLRDGVVSGLMHMLHISMGNSAEVKEVLTDILAARDAGKQYDPHGRERKRGRKPLIVDGTPQAQVAYTALGAGLSRSPLCLGLQ